MRKLLELADLKAWYDPKKQVLKGLDLELGEHMVVGLIGLNGAGKTTLMNVLCGLHEGYSCTAKRFEGKDLDFKDKTFKAQRYIVFSEDESFGYFSFDEYVTYVFGCYGKTPDKAYIDGLVEKFGFGEYRGTLIKDLSLGNRRKAYLITGFALKLPLLLLDEPVNGLDFNSTEALYALIAGYKQFGTVMFSSHILESVTLTSDKVLVLENGVIAKTYSGSDITAENIRASLEKEDGVNDV